MKMPIRKSRFPISSRSLAISDKLLLRFLINLNLSERSLSRTLYRSTEAAMLWLENSATLLEFPTVSRCAHGAFAEQLQSHPGYGTPRPVEPGGIRALGQRGALSSLQGHPSPLTCTHARSLVAASV